MSTMEAKTTETERSPMLMRDAKSSESPKDFVSEARELLANAATPSTPTLIRYEHGGGRLMIEDGNERKLIADFYDAANRELYYHAPELLSALCDQVEELTRRNQTQADSIMEFQAEQKSIRAAMDVALRCLEGTGDRTIYQVKEQLRSALTPKGEQS